MREPAERARLERAADDLRLLLHVIRTRAESIRDPRAPPDSGHGPYDDLDDIEEAVARAMDLVGELAPPGGEARGRRAGSAAR